MDSPYAVSAFNGAQGIYAMAASELNEKCLAFSANGELLETPWEDQGGTMNLCQLDGEGSFLAVQEFYKNFHSQTAGIVRAIRAGDGWETRRIADLPFVHRICVRQVEDDPYVIACTISDDKQNAADWSKPGQVYIGKVPKDFSQPLELSPLIEGIYKNHGLFSGALDGKEAILITGQEGVFRIDVPETESRAWTFEKILDREVSDVTVIDIDGDGFDELITIEGFHGDTIAVNKRVDGQWRIVYRYPVKLAHALWSGNVLGEPAVLVGYRGANGALVMLTFGGWRDGDLLMDVSAIDEHEGPTNIAVIPGDKVVRVFCCSGSKNRVMHYRLEDDA